MIIEKRIKILSPLRFERIENKLWQITDDFELKVDNVLIVVPADFVTDGASVPSCLWWFCAPIAGAFGTAAVVHDWMYNWMSPYNDRLYADAVFYSIGRHYGAGKIKSGLIYFSVRVFGAAFWKKNIV